MYFKVHPVLRKVTAMKKLISLILCLTTLFSLSSCMGNIIEKREETTTVSIETEAATEEITEEVTEVIAPPEPVVPEFTNPLTGLETTEELSKARPVAVMINNLKASMPQEGVSYADIIYECIVEGAQTRLLALCLDYTEVPVFGSVRSSREYFLDFAANHDAIYVHAGGSDEAYRQIKSRKVSNLDGVNMYLPDTFYRDSERRKVMAFEHTLMTSGEKIKSGIEFKKYRTELKEDFTSPFVFAKFGEEIIPSGEDAKYLGFKYSNAYKPYYIYNEENSVYERYQFGEAHIDNTTDKQLAFENIIVIFCPTYNTNDELGHYNVNCVGEGEGYYISRGTAQKIKWKKPAADTPVSFFTESGGELVINRGRTFIQVCTNAMKETTVISAETQIG